MGCVESRLEDSDMQANVFQVKSLDEHNNRSSRCERLEVTENSLILHNKNRAAIRWPLSCLRRYGYDGDTFAFESGRRCPSGPGIYSYRCPRAAEVFALLQNNIKAIADKSAAEQAAVMLAAQQQQMQGLPGLTEEYLRPLNHVVNDSRARSNSIMTTAAVPPINNSAGLLVNSFGGLRAATRSASLFGTSSRASVPNVISSLTCPEGSTTLPNNLHHHHHLHYNHILHPHPYETAASEAAASSANINSPGASPNTPVSPGNDIVYTNNSGLEVDRGSSAPPPTPDDVTPADGRGGRSVWLNFSDRAAWYSSGTDSRHRTLSTAASMPVCADRVPISPSHNSYLSSTCPDACKKSVIDPSSDYDPRYSASDSPQTTDSSMHVYMNVACDGERREIYANMEFDGKDLPNIPPRLSVTSGNTTSVEINPQPLSQVNYIVVDVDKGSDSSQVPPFSPMGSVSSGVPESPPARPASYATIDFERTEALMNTAKMVNCHMNGGRHNSTFAAMESHSSFCE